MVHLSILALKGNQGGRTFPYAGYLGLSKVTVEGVVRTRVEDDNRLLPASRLTISIRCYEARTRFGLSKVNLLVDATQTLWTAAEGLAYEDLGSSDYPFRISLPSKVAGFSTMQHPEYRIFWRLEAAINHLPLLGLGCRQLRAYDLALTRYDLPEPLSSSPLIDSPYLAARVPREKEKESPLQMQKMYMCQPPTSLPFLPPCQYRISLPSTTISPGTSFPVTLALHLPPSTHTSHTSPQLAFHSVSVILERRMDFYEASGAESAPELLSGTASSTPEPSPAASRSSFRSTASTATASTIPAPTPAHTPSSSIGSSTLTALGISIGRKRSASASPTTLPAKSLTTTIATAETILASGSTGSTQHIIELAVPPRPAPSQWPVGETTRTDLAAVAFYVRVKVGVVVVRPPSPPHTHRPPTSSSSASSPGAAPTVYEYELPEREVHMTNVTEEERALALARVADRRSRSRRPSASASDKQTSSGDSGGSADVPPLPRNGSTVKFELDDSPNGSVSAAMLNSRLKSVKASRDAASATAGVAGPPPVVNTSSTSSGDGSDGSGGSGSPLPSTGSPSPSASIPPIIPDMQDYNSYLNTPNEPPPVRSLTPRPQTASGAPTPAHNNHENTASPAHLIRIRRSQSGKAMYRPQSEVVSPHELDSARMHGVFLAPDWKDCGRAGGPSGGRKMTDGSKSDSETKVRARKDRSPTAPVTAMRTFDEPLLNSTLPHVPGKDDTPPPLPQKKPPPPSPTRPIPPPPSAYPFSVQQQQPQAPGLPTVPPTPPSKTATIDVWEKVLDRFATRGKRRSDEMRNQPSPSPSLSMSSSPSPSFSPMSLSPPGSASGHGHGNGHGYLPGTGIPQARFNTSARSSPNLLDPMSTSGTDMAARGRDKQRRTRGNSTVSSRSRTRKSGLFSSILSARA